MEDFTSFKYPFVYPETAYVPSPFRSHGDFLQAAALRYNISKVLPELNIEQLKVVLGIVKNADTHPAFLE